MRQRLQGLMADGLSVIYFTPSLAGLDLAFGYNQNTDNLGLDNSEFKDTYSVGFGYETFIGDVVLSLGGGIEKAIVTMTLQQIV